MKFQIKYPQWGRYLVRVVDRRQPCRRQYLVDWRDGPAAREGTAAPRG
jgi:hypothetical protein